MKQRTVQEICDFFGVYGYNRKDFEKIEDKLYVDFYEKKLLDIEDGESVAGFMLPLAFVKDEKTAEYFTEPTKARATCFVVEL